MTESMRKTLFHISFSALFATGVGILLTVSGCGKTAETATSSATGSKATEGSQHAAFDFAMEMVWTIDNFDPDQTRPKIAYNLNQWVKNQPKDNGWLLDPLASKLRPEYRRLPHIKNLTEDLFSIDDIRFLEEAYLLRTVSEWVSRLEHETDFANWLESSEQTIGADAAFQLGVAERLFDWIVRNVQQTALREYPKNVAAGPNQETNGRTQQKMLPHMQGIVGPGYEHFPWQILLFGEGDAWQRAWLFSLLARQQEIDVVVIAIRDPKRPGRPTPWLSAALIDDALYLFDTQLGVPIPNADGRGIATLAEVRANPSLLYALNIGSTLRISYGPEEKPVTPADLENAVILIEGSPGYLSHRMKLIQKQLPPNKRMVLSTAPAKIAKRLKKHGDVKIWAISYENIVYRMAFKQLVGKNQSIGFQWLQDEAAYQNGSSLLMARYAHLHKFLKTTGERKGAIPLYLEGRTPDRLMDAIASNPMIQRSAGIVQGPGEHEDAYKGRVKLTEIALRQSKQNSTYFLGLANYDAGNYNVAIDWLKGRILDKSAESRWTFGASYNLARTYEKLGRYKEARELYHRSDSPQRHGNLLRARRLRKFLKTEEADPTTSSTEAKSDPKQAGTPTDSPAEPAKSTPADDAFSKASSSNAKTLPGNGETAEAPTPDGINPSTND